MKLIVAQGNPGNEYAVTRHNMGFLALDFYAQQKNLTFQTKSKFFADIAEFTEADDKILLIKPLTYYNETGKAVRTIADFYKVDTPDILVVHDELALPFGTLRTREKGSDAGNNGIKSLNAHLGEDYARIRAGIRNDVAEKQGSFDFVLSKFTADEQTKLQKDILPKIAELIDEFAQGSHSVTSHTV